MPEDGPDGTETQYESLVNITELCHGILMIWNYPILPQLP